MNFRPFFFALLLTFSLSADEFTSRTCSIGAAYAHTALPGTSLFEPSFALNPKNPQEIALCWQKNVLDNNALLSYALTYTTDGGKSWQELDSPCGKQGVSDLWLRFSSDGKLTLFGASQNERVTLGSSSDSGRSWKVYKKLKKPEVQSVKESVLVLPKGIPDNDSWDEKEKRFSGNEVAIRLENGKLLVNDQQVAEANTFEYNINRVNGFLYIVYTTDADSNIYLISSRDGGATWLAPLPVNRTAHAKAFAPFVAITADGSVGILYFDLRNTLADCWLAIYKEVPGGLNYIEEHRLTEDSSAIPITCPGGMYVRDYPYLGSYKDGFFALFTMPNSPVFLSIIKPARI